MNAHVAPPSGAYFVEYFEHYLAGSIVKWKRFVAPKEDRLLIFQMFDSALLISF